MEMLAPLLGLSGLKFISLRFLSKQALPPSIEEMHVAGTVSEINVFPVKSCTPINPLKCFMGKDGLEVGLEDSSVVVHDREFMFWDDVKKTMVSGRQKSTAVLITCTLVPEGLKLSAPNLEDIFVSLEEGNKRLERITCEIFFYPVQCLDMGEEVGLWLDRHFQSEERRYKMVRLCAGRSVKEFWSQEPEVRVLHDNFAFGESDTSNCHDFAIFSLASLANVDELKAKLSDEEKEGISTKNFRMNVYVKGCPAWDEDSWEWIRIGVEGPLFRSCVPCVRCVFTTVDAATGQRNAHQQPLKLMREYRLNRKFTDTYPVFGAHCVLKEPGFISVNAPVYVSRRRR